MSLIELLVATSVGLSLAALLGHTVAAYQTHYHRAVTRIDGDQQAHFALALMAEELGALLQSPASSTCAAAGVQVAEQRVEFSANLYDRSTALRDDAPAGRSEVAVASSSAFEAGDLVIMTNLHDPRDPGDDMADCVRIAAISADQWTLESTLARSFPSGSPVVLVNRVTYALDRLGRLMRTQDGATQRVAQDVVAFDARVDGAALVIRLAVRQASEWTRRIGLEDTR
jgi:hypothetical protein